MDLSIVSRFIIRRLIGFYLIFFVSSLTWAQESVFPKKMYVNYKPIVDGSNVVGRVKLKVNSKMGSITIFSSSNEPVIELRINSGDRLIEINPASLKVIVNNKEHASKQINFDSKIMAIRIKLEDDLKKVIMKIDLQYKINLRVEDAVTLGATFAFRYIRSIFLKENIVEIIRE